MRCSFSGRSRPGGSRLCACFTFCRSCSAMPRSVAAICAAFDPASSARSRAASPFAVDCARDLRDVVHVARSRSRASTSSAHDWIRRPKTTNDATSDDDEPEQAQERRQPARRPEPAGASPRAARRRGAAAASARLALRLARRRLVLEEVELDVVVARVHTRPNLPRPFAGERSSPRREVEAEGVPAGPRAGAHSSDGTDRSGRSARAGWATSGSRATRRAASTSR